MRKISEMNLEQLQDLNKEELTVEKLHDLEEHFLVTSFQNIGVDGNHGELYRFDVNLIDGTNIDVYGDIEDIRENW